MSELRVSALASSFEAIMLPSGPSKIRKGSRLPEVASRLIESGRELAATSKRHASKALSRLIVPVTEARLARGVGLAILVAAGVRSIDRFNAPLLTAIWFGPVRMKLATYC